MKRDAIERRRAPIWPADRCPEQDAIRPAPASRLRPTRPETIRRAAATGRAGGLAARLLCGLEARQFLHPRVAIVAPADTHHSGSGLEGAEKGDQLIVLAIVLRLGGRVGKEVALFGIALGGVQRRRKLEGR